MLTSIDNLFLFPALRRGDPVYSSVPPFSMGSGEDFISSHLGVAGAETVEIISGSFSKAPALTAAPNGKALILLSALLMSTGFCLAVFADASAESAARVCAAGSLGPVFISPGLADCGRPKKGDIETYERLLAILALSDSLSSGFGFDVIRSALSDDLFEKLGAAASGIGDFFGCEFDFVSHLPTASRVSDFDFGVAALSVNITLMSKSTAPCEFFACSSVASRCNMRFEISQISHTGREMRSLICPRRHDRSFLGLKDDIPL